MPSANAILDIATRIANEAAPIAIAWHIVLVLTVAALIDGARPSQRTARVLVSTPFITVSALAFAFGNPFNGAVFGLAAVALITIAFAARSTRTSYASLPVSVVGIAAIAFGFVYPHFLTDSWTAYLYAAPLGLLPCPTLAVACGFALLGDGLGSRAWTFILATLGLIYGFIGVVVLGVYLDVPLFLTSGLLFYVGITSARSTTALVQRRSRQTSHAL